MLRTLTFILIAAAAAPAIARTPDPVQADKFRRELRLVVDQGSASIDTLPKQRAHQAKLQELEKRAQRLFGDAHEPRFGSCVKAAGMLAASWTTQTARPVSETDAALLARASFDAGVEYAACREAIDALQPQVSKECLVVMDLTKPNAPTPPRPTHCPKL